MTDIKVTTKDQVTKVMNIRNTDGSFWYTQSQLIETLGLPQASVSKTVRKMVLDGLLGQQAIVANAETGKAITQVCLIGLEQVKRTTQEQQLKADIQRQLLSFGSYLNHADFTQVGYNDIQLAFNELRKSIYGNLTN